MARVVACCFLFLLAPCVVLSERINEGVDTTSGWNLFGNGGPKVTDIRQGELGNCYYLAGLAAIANTHPKIIEDAFVMQGKSSQGRTVYQVRFLLDGVETLVALDEVVPATFGRRSNFIFSKTNDGDDIWPILMEKGWAKIFGSYLATRSGFPFEALKAITQAPVDLFQAGSSSSGKRHWPNQEQLWSAMREAVDKRFPMTASSMPNSIGVVTGHAFAVINLGGDKTKKTVEVYNPWARNRYNGELKTNQEQGAYTLTFEEFQQAFKRVYIARVRRNYRISFTRIPVNEPVAFKIKMKRKAPFTVQLEWPTSRFVEAHGCRLLAKHVKLMVRREGSDDWKSARWMSALTHVQVDFADKGTYLLYAYVSFRGAPVVSQAAVNVYAKEDVAFLEVDDKPALEVGREILGFPCQFLVRRRMWPRSDDVYEAVPFAVGGSPSWQKWGSGKVIWVGKRGRLTRAPALDQLDKELKGFDFEGLECRENVNAQTSRKDAPEPVEEEAVQSGCGFELGDRVLYRVEGRQTCAEIDAIDLDVEEVQVRYRITETESLSCESDDLERVARCGFQEGDEVEFNEGGRWLRDVVEEVDCGSLKLGDHGKVVCGDDSLLRYPHGCPFRAGEKISLWSESEGRWQNATVTDAEHGQVTVVQGPPQAAVKFPCDDEDHLRKWRRCDTFIHDQLERFSKLNNINEILSGDTDSLFPPNLDSIGPPSADCSDSADGTGPKHCDQFDTWGAISDVLD